MPYLNAKLSAPESAETTKTIAALLTDLTAGTLKKKRELTSVAVEYLSPARWFIGGADLASPFFADESSKDRRGRSNDRGDQTGI